jgi:hypothetical protein
MAGWGTGSWGTSPWGTGAGASTALSVSYAFASAQNRVTVALTAEPAHVNAAAPGDALNPATWTLTRLDTAASFTILSVAEVATTTNGYELTTLEPLGDLSVTHRVTAVALVDVAGNAAVPPLSADFNGILAQAGGDAPTPADDVVDLRYYHVSRNPIGGTLNIGSDGDYQVMGGVELVRKLIIRRLTTQPGEFFHIPDYGFPYSPKDVVRPVQLIKLKASLRETILLEPEVIDAGVALTLDAAAGVLTVDVRAQLQAAGETLEINTELPLGAVGF